MLTWLHHIIPAIFLFSCCELLVVPHPKSDLPDSDPVTRKSTEVSIMFMKSVWDDVCFVTWCIIVLDVAIRRLVNCDHEGVHMDINHTQIICGTQGRLGPRIQAVGAKLWPYHLCASEYIEVFRPGFFLVEQFWWVCVHCSLSFLFLVVRSRTWHDHLCCSTSIWRFKVLHILRCFPAHHNSTEWFSEWL